MVMLFSIQNWFSNPHTSGFLLFLMGGWAIFAIYHLLLFAKNKNSLYLLYGLYLIAIMGYQLHFLYPAFPVLGKQPYRAIILNPEFFAECSYLIYFLFTFGFLRISEEFPKWHYYIKRALLIIALYCIITLIVKILTQDLSLGTQFYHFFVIYILILSVITYIMFFRSSHPLRYYIIIGSLFLSVFSVISLFLTIHYNVQGVPYESAFTWLYTGYILETILFALALGHYQYLIYQERNQSQIKLIAQLKENEQLRLRIQQKLELDVKDLNRQAEEEKIENIKIRYEKELAELKVSALRSQMNPHFIFNSLNSIKRYIIDSEQENAVYYLNKFSKLIRKILSSSMASTIPLSEELEIAELYVNIENIRFNNTIDFTVEIDDKINIETLKVPSLILQPFLENAIWHGLANSKIDKQLKLEVMYKDSTHLKISIRDNGIGRERSAEIKSRKIHKRQSVGITLTEDRLRSFSKDYKNDYRLNFIDHHNQDAMASGTQVIIELPIK